MVTSRQLPKHRKDRRNKLFMYVMTCTILRGNVCFNNCIRTGEFLSHAMFHYAAEQMPALHCKQAPWYPQHLSRTPDGLYLMMKKSIHSALIWRIQYHRHRKRGQTMISNGWLSPATANLPPVQRLNTVVLPAAHQKRKARYHRQLSRRQVACARLHCPVYACSRGGVLGQCL